jgi:hypothetical protein
MALCVVLLVGGGLLIRTLRNLKNTPLGMDVDGLVVFGVKPNIVACRRDGRSIRNLLGKLRALPGVESVTVMEERIGSWWSDNSDMMVDGKLPDVASGRVQNGAQQCGGTGLLQHAGRAGAWGRDFADSDTRVAACGHHQ